MYTISELMCYYGLLRSSMILLYYLEVILLVGTGTCIEHGYMHMTKHVSYYRYYLVPVLRTGSCRLSCIQ